MSPTPLPARLDPLVSALVVACEQDPRVAAAWLSGSLARGTADDWSDIDLHLLVHDPESFGSGLRDWLCETLAVVLLDTIPGVPGAYIVITEEWLHVDVIVHGADGFRQDGLPARVLYDPDRRLREVPARPDEMAGEPYFPADEVRLFLYFMGATVTVVKREEWVALSKGTAMIRDTLLINLMLAENGIRKSDGAKRLGRYLTDQQTAALHALPPIGYDTAGLMAAQEAIAREYLTRSTHLATALDEPWPTGLAEASARLWAQELDIHL